MDPYWLIIVALIVLFIISVLYTSFFLGTKEIRQSKWELQRTNSNVFTYNGAKMNYVLSGSGRPLILLHGGGSWSYSFRNNIVPLSQEHAMR